MEVVILGAGAFGTALAHQLSKNNLNKVSLIARDINVANEINNEHSNLMYFSSKVLSTSIRASVDFSLITTADVLILAIPTNAIIETFKLFKEYLSDECLIINMAKGLFEDGQTIIDYISMTLNHKNVVTLKGASFAAELINDSPTLLTLGFQNISQYQKVRRIFDSTTIYLDYTTDILGVEILSAIKNVFAIYIGNVDARFNSSNARFLFMTKVLVEIKIILKYLGGKENTIFYSCGLGDLCLTSLNDLSRNRTLGLLIGKGFFNDSYLSNSVVLEGIKSLKLIDKCIPLSLKEDCRYLVN